MVVGHSLAGCAVIFFNLQHEGYVIALAGFFVC